MPMPVVIIRPEFWLEHLDELVEGLRIAATMPDERHVFDAGASVVLDQPAYWIDHVDELRAVLRESIVLEASAQQWLDVDAAMGEAYPPDKREPPEHDR
jgi:hypothetical protein